jgi:hypothetical protein
MRLSDEFEVPKNKLYIDFLISYIIIGLSLTLNLYHAGAQGMYTQGMYTIDIDITIYISIYM